MDDGQMLYMWRNQPWRKSWYLNSESPGCITVWVVSPHTHCLIGLQRRSPKSRCQAVRGLLQDTLYGLYPSHQSLLSPSIDFPPIGASVSPQVFFYKKSVILGPTPPWPLPNQLYLQRHISKCYVLKYWEDRNPWIWRCTIEHIIHRMVEAHTQ